MTRYRTSNPAENPKPRCIRKLLQIVLERIDLIHDDDGLCILISHIAGAGVITPHEKKILREFIDEHVPINGYTIVPQIMNKIKPECRYFFYWYPGKVAPRKRYLEKHIERLKKQELKQRTHES